ncbi:MAG: alpha/beta fold hydrolase [Herminiimonas sp.]|nr:alpha/beta fold hydrolase [Herminiimonas sp.]
MRFDTDLHRHTLKLDNRLDGGKPFEMSVVDAGPQGGDRKTAPTMVFLHGFGGRAAYWEYQLEQFQDDYRVVALDLRGHGYSDAPDEDEGARYDVPELVADIEAALDALGVPQRFTLVCHSFGGALSAYFIGKHPQRVIALVIIASAVEFRLRLVGRMLLRVPPSILTWLREVLPYLGFNAAKVYPPAHVVYLQNRNALSPWNGAEALRRIRVPTLVILGQKDILFSDASYKEVARLIPGAEQVVIPVSAHQVMVERPDAVNRAIERFLQSLVDPVELAERKLQQKTQRRAARKALEAERPWLKFYDARTPYRIRMPTVALPRLLEATARRFGSTPALDYFGKTISWRELERLANRFAHGLLAMRLKRGERVALALPNTPQWVIAYFAILKAGAVAVLVDATDDTGQLLARLADTDAAMLITTSDRYDELRDILQTDPRAAGVRRVVFASMLDFRSWREQIKFALLHHVQEGHWLPWFRRDDENRKRERRFAKFNKVLLRGAYFPPGVTTDVEDVAVIAHTFGSTGKPLPVPLTHRNLAANALQLRHWLPESRPGDERFLAQQPLSSAYGLTGLLHLGVYLGATLILVPGSDVNKLLKTVKKMRPTYFPTTPYMIRQLTHTPGVRRFGLASIRVCAVSGSPLAQEIREEFEKITRGRLIEAYGLTEASPAVLAMPVAARRQFGVVGLPLPDTEARIVDLDSGGTAATDTIGELWIRGPQVFGGYGDIDLRHQKATAARLQNGWLATGDIASVDEDGFFTIVDRKEHMLVRGGQRVFPRHVEEILFEHPTVSWARVTREADEEGLPHLRASVLLHRNTSVTVEELLKYCAKRLHPGALPDSISIENREPAA